MIAQLCATGRTRRSKLCVFGVAALALATAVAPIAPSIAQTPPYSPGDFQNRSIVFGGSSLTLQSILAAVFAGTVSAPLTATGTNQATALSLPLAAVELVTTAPAGTGVALNSANVGLGGEETIVNESPHVLAVYPTQGTAETIGGAAATSVPVGIAVTFQLVTSTNWVQLGASNGAGAFTITDGTNSVAGVTTLTVVGATVSGTSPNGIITLLPGGCGSSAYIFSLSCNSGLVPLL